MEKHNYAICYGEEHPQYAALLRKYSHVGCPDAHYEDNCAHPADCALAGQCLDMRDRQAENAEIKESALCPRGGECPFGGFCPDCVEASGAFNYL